MGRGRAKAKQTKVARRLKYTTTGTDLDRLRAELSGDTSVASPVTSEAVEVEDDLDEWELEDEDEDEEDED